MDRTSRKTIVSAMVALSLSATFLVGGYEFVRSVSTSLFIDAYGSKFLPYAMAVLPVVLGFFIYSYGWLLSRIGPLRAMVATSGFSAIVFVACWAALNAGFKPAAAVLYIYRQIYIVLVLEQYWSLVNSTLTPEQAKLYNGPIIGGASIGPVGAGFLIHKIAGALGSEQFILLGALALVPASLLAWLAYRFTGEPRPSPQEAGGRRGHVNLKLLLQSRRLLLLAVIVGVTQIISTMLSLRFYALLEASIPGKDAVTAYLGAFWAATNGVAFLFQFLAAPLVLRFVPLRWVHFGIPAVHILSAAVLLAAPGLRAAAGAFLLFKVLDYSLFRAGKEILYIPLSFDARYRAKQVIDTFMYRFSSGVTGAAVSVAGAAVGTLSGAVFPATALAAALVWAGLSFPLTSPEARRAP